MSDESLDDLFVKLEKSTTDALPQPLNSSKDGNELTFDDILEATKDEPQPFLKSIEHYNSLKSNTNQAIKSLEDSSSTTNKGNSSGESLILEIPMKEKKLSKKQVREAREVTSGDKWFNMPKGNRNDPQIKKDLLIIQQRAVLDPKRHYKKDKWTAPKYFQVGTIIEDKLEFFSARLKKKERQQTMLQEVLHDKDSSKYFRRKYAEIQEQKSKVIKYKSKKKFGYKR